MKRNHWIHLESHATLEEAVKALKRLYDRHNYSTSSYLKEFKYKIVYRQHNITDVGVCTKELMVQRLKYGI